MAKKKLNKHFTPLFNEVLEGMAYAKLSPNEWQFIMVLWRLTYGRKNMAHKESGKFTTWINAEFHRRTGISKQNINRIKNTLLKKKIILKKKGMIGFNKHFEKWDKGSQYRLRSPSRLHSQDRHKEYSAQTTDVVSTDYSKAPKVKSSAEVESLKKERKKEITKNDFYTDEFLSFWEQYPKKKQKHAAAKAWRSHYHKHGRFELGNILTLLQKYIKVDWAGREEQYIPHAASWLNKRPWEDSEMVNVLPPKELVRKEWLKWQGGGITEEEFKKRREQILNTYKENA